MPSPKIKKNTFDYVYKIGDDNFFKSELLLEDFCSNTFQIIDNKIYPDNNYILSNKSVKMILQNKSKLLKNKNIGKLYLAVSHMTVNWPTPKLYKIFDKIFTTNSKGLNYLIDTFGKPITNLEIINLFKDGI